MDKELEEKRGILVFVDRESDSFEEGERKEFEEISWSAGWKVLGIIEARVKNPFYKYYLGRGKVEEIKSLLESTPEVNFVLFNVEITPSQQKNLEEIWQVPVYTKNALIHEIFAQRAHTAQGKIKVELARLRYQLSRLTGKGKDLSQTGGGIGTRGPGEQKIEVERRKIKDRIAHLNQELTKIEKQREVQRNLRRERNIPNVALVGYTNAGKSTLLNALTGSQIYVEKRMFATLDPTTRKLFIPGVGETLFTDTVGFIREMPPTIKDAFRATLEEIKDADLILEVIDLSDKDYYLHFQIINQLLEELEINNSPRILVFNKVDLLRSPLILEREIEENYTYIFVSAQNLTGLKELKENISFFLRQEVKQLHLQVTYSQLPIVQKEIYHQGYIKELKTTKNGEIMIECIVRKEAAGKIRRLSQVQVQV